MNESTSGSPVLMDYNAFTDKEGNIFLLNTNTEQNSQPSTSEMDMQKGTKFLARIYSASRFIYLDQADHPSAYVGRRSINLVIPPDRRSYIVTAVDSHGNILMGLDSKDTEDFTYSNPIPSTIQIPYTFLVDKSEEILLKVDGEDKEYKDYRGLLDAQISNSCSYSVFICPDCLELRPYNCSTSKSNQQGQTNLPAPVQNPYTNDNNSLANANAPAGYDPYLQPIQPAPEIVPNLPENLKNSVRQEKIIEWISAKRDTEYRHTEINEYGEIKSIKENTFINKERSVVQCDFKVISLKPLMSTSGDSGYYKLIVEVGSQYHDIYLESSKMGEPKYLLKKFNQENCHILTQKIPIQKQIAADVIAKLMQRQDDCIEIASNTGWVRLKDTYRFVEEEEQIWEKVRELAK